MSNYSGVPVVDSMTMPPATSAENTTEYSVDFAAPLAPPPDVIRWPVWQRILLRFFFVYWMLTITPWNWLNRIPFFPLVNGWYGDVVNWLVTWTNANVLHIATPLVPTNGSGDTSWAWTEFYMNIGLALIGCVIWSIIARKRPNLVRALYWLRQIVRYYLAITALSYGFIKIFPLQMPFPALSQLATPLGDLLPMRLSWLFIGYSAPYQIFSGVMETMAGLLLFYRRTVTAGLLLAAAAFANVFMINLAYDVPVKLFSMHLFAASLFMLALDSRRLIAFLVLNRPVEGTQAFVPHYSRPWHKWVAVGAKVFLVYYFVWTPFNGNRLRFAATKQTPRGVVPVGFYDVRSFVVNGDTVRESRADSVHWKDVAFDSPGGGSVNSQDTLFWQRYRRGYFRYKADTATHTVTFWRGSFVPRDSTFLFTMHYDLPDSATVKLAGTIRGDSVRVELARSNRHFQLTERQFHRLSEYNR